jgi:hypothetical protein
MNVGRATNGSPVFQGKIIELPDIYNLRINSRRRHDGDYRATANVGLVWRSFIQIIETCLSATLIGCPLIAA